MNVGLVLCFPNAVSVLSRTQVLWEAWRQQTAAVTAGPISASKFSTVPVAFQVDPLAQPGTVTLYLGANRGRGQAYPNGDISNVVVSRSEAVGLCPGRCRFAKRLGISCWTRSMMWRMHMQLVGVGHAISPTSGLRAFGDESVALDAVLNVGGFGQTDEQFVIQSESRIFAGLAFLLAGTSSQLALVVKKKQYERVMT